MGLAERFDHRLVLDPSFGDAQDETVVDVITLDALSAELSAQDLDMVGVKLALREWVDKGEIKGVHYPKAKSGIFSGHLHFRGRIIVGILLCRDQGLVSLLENSGSGIL